MWLRKAWDGRPDALSAARLFFPPTAEPYERKRSSLAQCGLAIIYDPLDQPVECEVKLPLYYTGLATPAAIRVQVGTPQSHKLDRQYNVAIPVTVSARAYPWSLIE